MGGEGKTSRVHCRMLPLSWPGRADDTPPATSHVDIYKVTSANVC